MMLVEFRLWIGAIGLDNSFHHTTTSELYAICYEKRVALFTLMQISLRLPDPYQRFPNSRSYRIGIFQ